MTTKLAYADREAAARRNAEYSKPWARPRVNVIVNGHEMGGVNMPGDKAAEYLHQLENNWLHPREIETLEKKADALPEIPPELRARFNHYAKLLNEKGTFAGTSHRRITIPKDKMTEEDLRTLRFEPVVIAVPEAGQDRFQSFRHPDNNFHLHSHPGRWTMHRDDHPSATMLARKQGRLKAFVYGLPHVITEGIPGMANYIGGQIAGRQSTADEVDKTLDPEVANAIKTSAEETRLKKQQRGFYLDKSPGYHNLNGTFEASAKANPEAPHAPIVKQAVEDALALYGLRRKEGAAAPQKEDPLEQLSRIYKTTNFGYGKKLQPDGQSSALSMFNSVGGPNDMGHWG
jgi:hypothetical protein